MINIIGDEIYTKRLIMRKLTLKDLDEYYEIARKDEVGKWLSTSRGKTYEETKRTIEYFLEHWDKKGFGTWGVINKESGELLGHCGLNYLGDTKEVEVLYAFDPKAWGKGYGKESAKASIEYGFSKTNLERLIAVAKTDNVRSKGVIEGCGFKYIGNKEYFKLNLDCYEILK